MYFKYLLIINQIWFLFIHLLKKKFIEYIICARLCSKCLGYNKTNKIPWPHLTYVPVTGMVGRIMAPQRCHCLFHRIYECVILHGKWNLAVWSKPWKVEIILEYAGGPNLNTWAFKAVESLVLLTILSSGSSTQKFWCHWFGCLSWEWDFQKFSQVIWSGWEQLLKCISKGFFNLIM